MIPKVICRAPGQYDPDLASEETGLLCEDPSRTVQSQADEADINSIVARFGLTGELPQNVRAVLAQDFAEVFDFQSAMNVIRAAEESFMQMPAGVRMRFQNSPHQFVQFVSDSANVDECVKLGLAIKKEVVQAEAEPKPS